MVKSISFTPFLKDKEVKKTCSKLPHWSQVGATHFVTFRLADSIPKMAMVGWLAKRKRWLSEQRVDGEEEFSLLSKEQRKEYRRLFGASFERLLDQGAGCCLLKESQNAAFVAEALEHFDGKRYDLGDYVVMPNHVHLLVRVFEEFPLGVLLKSWKGFSTRQINQAMGRSGQLWQRESFDHIVRSRSQLEKLQDYIADNPTKAGLREEECLVRRVEWR